MLSKAEESVIRQVVPTNNFALMQIEKISDDDISEQHKKCAKQIRLAHEHAALLTEPGSDNLAITRLDLSQTEFIQPILFEECYVMAESQEFINQVK